jgi:hypothetical protein
MKIDGVLFLLKFLNWKLISICGERCIIDTLLFGHVFTGHSKRNLPPSIFFFHHKNYMQLYPYYIWRSDGIASITKIFYLPEFTHSAASPMVFLVPKMFPVWVNYLYTL